MGTPDRFNQLNDLLVELKVATEQELARFLHESQSRGKASLWAYMREIGRLSQPQADTLDMAAKGYIPVEAARVSIKVQGRINNTASDADTVAREAPPAAFPPASQPPPATSVKSDKDPGARGLLKIQRSAGHVSPASKEKEVSGRFEALLADNIIALPTVRPSTRRATDSTTRESGEEHPVKPIPTTPRRTADPSSVAAWKQIVDSIPSEMTSKRQVAPTESLAPAPPPKAKIPNWLPMPRPRESEGESQHHAPASASTVKASAGVTRRGSDIGLNARTNSGLVGRQLGKFQISNQIGRGSSGSVYMGHHIVLNMPVAIKVLDPGLAAFHPELLKRFKHEARSAARIAHPNIVRVIDCDHIDGFHIIVMEYVDGISVSELVKINGQVAEERALVIVQAVAEGLEAALECGIIHRDIKPANIMITKNKQVKLADLGLAKRVDDPTNMSDTRPNIGLGTPHYFAPEQACNAVGADHRADIYSLGATLYNMLTGSVPFKGKTIADLIRKHREEPLVPPRQLVPQLTRATSDLTVYMMAKRPEDRPQNYADLLNAINASIYNLKNLQSQNDAATKAGNTIVRDILNLFSTRK